MKSFPTTEHFAQVRSTIWQILKFVHYILKKLRSWRNFAKSGHTELTHGGYDLPNIETKMPR